jgi:THO complex subunit 2
MAWLPELSAIFDDIKKIAPRNTYDVIGPALSHYAQRK